MSEIPHRPLLAGHEDFSEISAICKEIERLANGWPNFNAEIPKRLRTALDEVIDMPRTGRFLLSEIEKTEKTYVGTKVEILVRDYLDIPKGMLDLVVNDVDVDVKNTVTRNWMIPYEAIGKPCILVREDEENAFCWFGVIIAHQKNLTSGLNRDRKASISARGMQNIHWLLEKHPYPPNFWQSVSSELRLQIADPKKSGVRRLEQLFLEFPEKPIARNIVASVARQKDFMKRLRGNGGVRDLLGPAGIALLHGNLDKKLISQAKLPAISNNEFIAVRIRTPEMLTLVRDKYPSVSKVWSG